MAYVPLHVHSVYSPYEGMITPEELVARAAFLKFPAVGLTDHWSTYGHHQFYRLAIESGLKPILGVELRHPSLVGGDGLYHITLLAENDRGYHNLVRLVNLHTQGKSDGHVTEDELARHSEGMIALTGCTRGETAYSILHGNLGRVRDIVQKLLAIYGEDNLFLEIMNHNLPEERLIVDHLTLISKRIGVPLIATNNDRYLNKSDGEYCSILRMIRDKEAAKEADISHDEFYLKRGKELEPYFYSIRDALDQSGIVAERCTVTLPVEGRLRFSAVQGSQDRLRELAHRRLLLRFHDRSADESARLKELMEKELACLEREGLSGFMIFVRELTAKAARKGIWLELMSSSILESFLAYLLGIIPLNPLEHDLSLESFTTARPGTPPPVEFITSEGSREAFITILKELLPGYDPFFQMTQEAVSFQMLLKEVGEVLGMPREVQEELGRLSSVERRHRTLAAMLESSEALRHLYKSEEVVRRTLHAADVLRGKLFRFHMNSSRLVILPKSLKDVTSFITGPAGERFVQMSNATIEVMGGWIVVIQHSHFLSALERVLIDQRKKRSEMPSLFGRDSAKSGNWLPEILDDPKVYALVSSGNTDGVYLLESQGMRDLLMKVQPDTFDELVNVISLYRPAPLEGRLWQRYLENAEKKGKVKLPHHLLAASLENTRGLLLYNEQVREILNYTAGLECEHTVSVENAIRNKDTGELSQARLEYMRGAMDKGL
ncbi:MAG: PHP domain-containing protein, partial [candidate division WOR-3 bacterium]